MRAEELPQGWRSVPLSELVRDGRPICYGVLKPGEYHPNGVPLVRIVDLIANEVDENGLFRIGSYLDAEFARSRLTGGEVLLSIQGTVGRVAIASSRLAGANISRTIARIDICDGMSPAFIRHWMLSNAGQRAFEATVVGTTRNSLNIGALRKLPIPLPPLPEQRRIADILDTLDEAIRTTEQVIAKLQQMKQGLLHDLVTRGIDENSELRDHARHPEQFKDSPLGRIPKSWEVARLAELAEVTVAYVGPTNPFYTSQGRGVLFLRTGNITADGISLTDVRWVTEGFHKSQPKSSLLAGDVVVSRVGYTGTAAVVPDLGPTNCANMIIIRCSQSLAADWVRRLFEADTYIRQVNGFTAGSAQPVLNITLVERLLTLVPPVREQQAIATVVSRLDHRVGGESATLGKLRILKQGLTEDLLDGRVRVTVPEDAA